MLTGTGSTKAKTVSYTQRCKMTDLEAMQDILIEAIKEIDQLKGENAALQARIADLELALGCTSIDS